MSDTGFYDANFVRSATEATRRIRLAAFLGEDFGQFSWITADEHRRLQSQLSVTADSRVLEIASGSGGPGLFLAGLTGCTLIGLDIHEGGVEAANKDASERGLSDRVSFRVHDAREDLPLESASVDAVICIDSINHFFDRQPVFEEWHRVLRAGGAVWFTDPAVVTGPLRREEVAGRSPAMGEFVFTPPGRDEILLREAGFATVDTEDLTAGIAGVSKRWHDEREHLAVELDAIEGVEENRAFQMFLSTVHTLSEEHRLARIAYIARKAVETPPN